MVVLNLLSQTAGRATERRYGLENNTSKAKRNTMVLARHLEYKSTHKELMGVYNSGTDSPHSGSDLLISTPALRSQLLMHSE